MVLLTLFIIVAVVYVELGQRRIPVQFAKRVVGRRMMGGQNTYIPLKVNQSGVIPIIFASSILLLPVIMTQFLGSGEGWRGEIASFVDKYIVNPQNFVYITIFAAADHRVRLLLQLDRVRPDPPGRPAAPPGWLHPRRSPRPADRAVPREGRQPHHAAGRRVHRHHRDPAVHPADHRRTSARSPSPVPLCSSRWVWHSS